MKSQEIIILVVLIFIILFMLNNRQENYDKLVIVPEKENIKKKYLDGNWDMIGMREQKNKDFFVCKHTENPVNCNGTTYYNICHAKCAGEDTSKCESGWGKNKNKFNKVCMPIEPVKCNGTPFYNICQAYCAGQDTSKCRSGWDSQMSSGMDGGMGGRMGGRMGIIIGGIDMDIIQKLPESIRTIVVEIGDNKPTLEQLERLERALRQYIPNPIELAAEIRNPSISKENLLLYMLMISLFINSKGKFFKEISEEVTKSYGAMP